MRLLVASDVHLGPHTPSRVDRALARCLQSHPDHELVLAGDIFDLSLEPRGSDLGQALNQLITRTSELPRALRKHLSAGQPVTLLVGNHDAELLTEPGRDALLRSLELHRSAPLHVAPWFIRRGGVHIEHGHLYDPDNAPTHPLACWKEGTEPLGIALTRRFLVPSGATYFAHAHQTTPLKGLLDAFVQYGINAPRIVYQYFHAAICLTLESRATSPQASLLQDEKQLGQGRLGEFAESVGLDLHVLTELLRGATPPTHHDFAETFMRLYFDRILCAVIGTVGSAALLPLHPGAALGLALLASAYLAQSIALQGSRYSEAPRDRLRTAAARVAETSGADLVVFGHTHHEDEAPGYINSGSFAFGRQESHGFLVIEDGVARRS
ncbi:MAG: metallophosphoesterase [Myxococcales bacterium]|nr:metallophosphoesterase [Myxococcales bacterium]